GRRASSSLRGAVDWWLRPSSAPLAQVEASSAMSVHERFDQERRTGRLISSTPPANSPTAPLQYATLDSDSQPGLESITDGRSEHLESKGPVGMFEEFALAHRTDLVDPEA